MNYSGGSQCMFAMIRMQCMRLEESVVQCVHCGTCSCRELERDPVYSAYRGVGYPTELVTSNDTIVNYMEVSAMEHT